MFFTTSCQAELTTRINCDLAVTTVLWLSSLTILDSCSKTCISVHKLFFKLILPSYCTLLRFVNFSLKVWWMMDGFIFQRNAQVHVNIYPITVTYTPVWPHEEIDRCDRCIGRRNNTATRFFLISNTFSTLSKLFAPNMYCLSCKILVTLYWTHLRLNGICDKYCPQQTNNRKLFLLGWFQQQRCHI